MLLSGNIIGIVLLLGGTQGCTDSIESCERTLSCLPDSSGGAGESGGKGYGVGDGDGDSGGSETGGESSGGGGGFSGGGDGGTGNSGGNGTGGLGGEPFSCSDCTGSKPICIEDDEKCVECTAEEDARCNDDSPVCGPGNQCVECNVDGDCTDASLPGCSDNICVACTQNVHCTEATASLCDTDTNACASCTENADCAHLDDLNVCDAGTCVACLTEADCDDNVCDPSTHTCTDIPARSEDICQPCQHDAQCFEGQVCVEMTYDDPSEGVVGTFCQWLRDATELGAPAGSCGLNSRPYAQQATLKTVDGVEVTICRLATTTCPAFLDHRQTIDGCETPGTDDAACGDPAFNDGRCRNNSSTEPKCSYPCLGNEDCPAGATCPAGSDRYCSL